MLIAAGADVQHLDENGWTPLMVAAMNTRENRFTVMDNRTHRVNRYTSDHDKGMTECIRTLLEAGADVNKQDAGGKTPLIAAAELPLLNLDAFVLLIKSGADVSIRYGATGKNAMETLRASDTAWIQALQRAGLTPVSGVIRELDALATARKGVTQAIEGGRMLGQIATASDAEALLSRPKIAGAASVEFLKELLTRRSGEITTQTLIKLASLDGVTQYWTSADYGQVYDSGYTPIDCTDIRSMAAEELRRRGPLS